MIYTVTINPSIDYYMYLDKFYAGRTNRSNHEDTIAGGKGFNVSEMLNVLKDDNIALGIVAGDTGDLFEKLLAKTGIKNKLFHLESGNTRINVKINENDETEINGNGPIISEQTLNQLLFEISDIKPGDVLILSGSIAKSNSENIYRRILNCVQDGVLTIVDTSSKPLLYALQERPFLIKPNFFELEEVIRRKINTDNELIVAMKSLQKAGAKNVLVSLGKQGACILTEDNHLYFSSANSRVTSSTVGAGDSLVAGFVSTYLKTRDYRISLVAGVACGSAKAEAGNSFPKLLEVKEKIMNTHVKQIF